jgi:hypothetical protein
MKTLMGVQSKRRICNEEGYGVRFDVTGCLVEVHIED